MKIITVTFKCEAGHEQKLTFIDMNRKFVEGAIALMDGSSDMFVSDPRNDPSNTWIGICQYPDCGKPFVARVIDEVETN